MTLKSLQALLALTDGSKHRGVLTSSDLRALTGINSEATFAKTVKNAVKSGLLHRVKKGLFVYVNTATTKFDIGMELVKAFRSGEFTYISLESALSKWSVISQIPFTLTMMTTGRSGEIHSPQYGDYEFVHTDRDILQDIEARNIIVYHDRIALAKPQTALRDLKRVGRNTHLIDMQAYEEALKEAAAMPV